MWCSLQAYNKAKPVTVGVIAFDVKRPARWGVVTFIGIRHGYTVARVHGPVPLKWWIRLSNLEHTHQKDRPDSMAHCTISWDSTI